jgi:hypothetical protein
LHLTYMDVKRGNQLMLGRGINSVLPESGTEMGTGRGA